MIYSAKNPPAHQPNSQSARLPLEQGVKEMIRREWALRSLKNARLSGRVFSTLISPECKSSPEVMCLSRVRQRVSQMSAVSNAFLLTHSKWYVPVCVCGGGGVAFRCLFLFCYGSTCCSSFISLVWKLASLSSCAYLLHRCDKMRSSS